ncbi:MAG: transporter substrate-binding protein [Herbaspirillum sp.]|jgi:peptide/nickel transport system substrate-binding protein|nr:transporter substrate-binding protein [Herbaspirillum sp.]
MLHATSAIHRIACAIMTALCLSCAATAQAQTQTITVVMHVSLRSLDPVISTTEIVRNYGYMVYDTLLARDAKDQVQPQMAEKWTVSPDGKAYTFTLRDGLKWHDGAPVTADDCVASIRRWATQDKLGQVMTALMADMKVIDAKTFTMTFKEPTNIVLRALSRPSNLPAFMMPLRVAQTPPGVPIKETIGSGPFRFVNAEYRPGVQAMFEKFKDYVPRREPASGLAGGKVVKVDRVKWLSISDPMTAVNALLNNEIDVLEDLPEDLLPMVENNPDVVLTEYKEQGQESLVRLNHTQPPFNNKLIRQAALRAMDQEAVLQAQVGNPKYYRVCASLYGCDSIYATNVDADKFVKGDPVKAAAMLKAAKYDGTPVVILRPTDDAASGAMPPVYAQALRKAGFNVQVQDMDGATVTVRRTSKEPISKGGWSIFSTMSPLSALADPVGSQTIAANGAGAWFGWPDVPAIEVLRLKMARTSDLAEQKKIAVQLQRLAIDEVTVIPLGERSIITATRKNVSHQVRAAVPVFWDMTKS